MRTKKECLHKNTMTTDFFVEDYETPVYTRVRCKDCGIIVEKTQL